MKAEKVIDALETGQLIDANLPHDIFETETSVTLIADKPDSSQEMQLNAETEETLQQKQLQTLQRQVNMTRNAEALNLND